MKILWSDFATQSLLEIYLYYKEVANVDIARKIKASIFSTTKQLLKHPQSGQIEKNLVKLNQNHRYLIDGNYKIVYKEVSEGILISDIFDCRQDPTSIMNEKRNVQH